MFTEEVFFVAKSKRGKTTKRNKNRLNKDEKFRNMLSFAGSDKEPLPKALFELWDYLVDKLDNESVVELNDFNDNSPLEMIENSLELFQKPNQPVISRLTKGVYYTGINGNIVLKPTNVLIKISTYRHQKTNEKIFYFLIRSLEYEDGNSFIEKRLDVLMDDYLESLYIVADKWKKASPNKWEEKDDDGYEIDENWQENIKKFCEELKIDYKFSPNTIFFSTPFGHWRVDEYDVLTKNHEITLFHQNRRGNSENWHRQKYRTKSVFSVIKYIYKHDYLRFKISTENFV